MTIPEKIIQSDIVRWIKQQGFMVNKLLSCSLAGWPDLIVIKKGVTYYFEVKRENGKVSELQKQVIGNLNREHKIAFVVHSLGEFQEIFLKL